MRQFQALQILGDANTRTTRELGRASYKTNVPLAEDLGVELTKALSERIAALMSARIAPSLPPARMDSIHDPGLEKRSRSGTAEDDFPFDLEQLFDERFAEVQEELEKNLESLLLGALLAGAGSVLRAWLARFGYADCSEPKPTPGLIAAAREMARQALEYLRSKLWRWVQELALRLWRGGASPEEIAREIQQALADPKRVESEIESLMGDVAFNAVTEGEYQAHDTMKTKPKRWLTVRDFKVCLRCRLNEWKGWIALEERFPSGDYKEKAHALCRCRIETEGVTAVGLASALQTYGIVCRIEPGSS